LVSHREANQFISSHMVNETGIRILAEYPHFLCNSILNSEGVTLKVADLHTQVYKSIKHQ
jgi:hypothetical protein